MTIKFHQEYSRDYRVILEPLPEEDGGGWLARIPDLPGCVTDGETPEEALKEIDSAKKAWITAQISRGRPVPQPSNEGEREYSGKLTLRLPKSLHRRLALKAEREGISLNQYLLSLISENHVRSTVEHTMVILEEPSEAVYRANQGVWYARLAAAHRVGRHESPSRARMLLTQRVVSTVKEQTFDS